MFSGCLSDRPSDVHPSISNLIFTDNNKIAFQVAAISLVVCYSVPANFTNQQD